jgi:hypothetical protein
VGTSGNISCAVWEQVGLWESCVGTSGNLSSAVWEQVGLWGGCVETGRNVSCTVWEQVGLWEEGIAVTNDTGPGLVRTPLQCITGPTSNYLYCLYTYRNTLPNLLRYFFLFSFEMYLNCIFHLE